MHDNFIYRIIVMLVFEKSNYALLKWCTAMRNGFFANLTSILEMTPLSIKHVADKIEHKAFFRHH
jgi:hypothetical protein